MNRPNTTRTGRILLMLSFVLVMGTTHLLAQQQTLVGAKLPSKGARTQPCYADSCADTTTLSVTLPVGATYVATHYFTNAGYPNDYADVRETGPGEVSYARFSAATHAVNNQNQEVVTVFYYNRSNRNRLVSISVDYLP